MKMKTVMVCLLAVFTTCASPSVSREKPGTERIIAVLDLHSLGFSDPVTAVLSDTLRGEIVRSLYKKPALRYSVLECSNADKILDELDVGNKGLSSDEISLEMGKLMQVDAIVFGFAGYMGSTSSLSVRIVDVGTGRIIAAADRQCKGRDDNDLVRLARKVSGDLISGLSKDASRYEKQAAAFPSPLYSIAVLDLETGNLSETEGKLLSEKLRSSVVKEIGKGKPYIPVERSRMGAVLKAQTLNTDGQPAVEYGKLLQSDGIVTGSVSNNDGTFTVKATIIDVESGKTTRSVERRHRGTIDEVLVSVIPDIGRRLVARAPTIYSSPK